MDGIDASSRRSSSSRPGLADLRNPAGGVPFLLFFLSGCIWPTTVGIHTDGILPPAGDVELTAMGGGGTVWTGGQDSIFNTGQLIGAQGVLGLTDHMGLSTGYAYSGVSYYEVELRWRPTSRTDHGLYYMLSGGISGSFPWKDGALGWQSGGLAGWRFAGSGGFSIQPYLGARYNQVFFSSEDDMLWLLPATGVSARWPGPGGCPLVVGVEVWKHWKLNSRGTMAGGLVYAGIVL